MILSIDPGLHPAYTLLDPTVLVDRKYFRRPLPLVLGSWEELPAELPGGVTPSDVIVEGQWLYSAKAKRAILKLSLEAGWQLCAACLTLGGVPWVKPVETQRGWRADLRLGRISKEGAQNRCERSLLPVESRLLDCRRAASRSDRLDSIMIAWGFFLGGGDALGEMR